MKIKMDVLIEREALDEAMRVRGLPVHGESRKRFLRILRNLTLTLPEDFFEQITKNPEVLASYGLQAEGEESPPLPAKAAEKQQVAPLVFLSEKEIGKLKMQYGEEVFLWMVQKLHQYKESKGRQYDSDYQAIQRWVVRAYEEERKKGSFRASSPPPSLAEEDLERRLIRKRETINRQAEQRRMS
ncbi:MAG: hypothetical protein Q4A78_08725 [Peptostreptococcaceae bacterium]|nr:hypothetical protein [Peptostreptococcaceae bacterium]